MQGPRKDPLISTIDAARQRYGFSAAEAEQLLHDFTKPKPELRRWIFELCDPAPRDNPFVDSGVLTPHFGATQLVA